MRFQNVVTALAAVLLFVLCALAPAPANAQVAGEEVSLFSLQRTMVTVGIDHEWFGDDGGAFLEPSGALLERDWRVSLNPSHDLGYGLALGAGVGYRVAAEKVDFRLGVRWIAFSGRPR